MLISNIEIILTFWKIAKKIVKKLVNINLQLTVSYLKLLLDSV